jgi:hypothetical protein
MCTTICLDNGIRVTLESACFPFCTEICIARDLHDYQRPCKLTSAVGDKQSILEGGDHSILNTTGKT